MWLFEGEIIIKFYNWDNSTTILIFRPFKSKFNVDSKMVFYTPVFFFRNESLQKIKKNEQNLLQTDISSQRIELNLRKIIILKFLKQNFSFFKTFCVKFQSIFSDCLIFDKFFVE